MKVLAIRGKNLASLAGSFEVDLTADPLASAGLFAITGETGAGKSTILDALCLALYGSFPRLKRGKTESVPDSSGELIAASDERTILQRGRGQGFAEVDFVGTDGKTYRARWEVHRAYGRANGGFQQALRTLSCLDDGSTVAGTVNAVKAKVPCLTGLTFDQFCRTVLLAQGEFDQFLDAANSERGELLEKITGTEIYAEISKAVFEKHKAEHSVLTDLRQRHDELHVLSAEERATLEAQWAHLVEEVQAHQARASELDRVLQFRNAVRLLRSEVKNAERELVDAQAASEDAVGERTRWVKLQRAESLRPVHQQFVSLRLELPGAEQALTEALSRLQSAREAERVALQNLEAAEAAGTQAQAACESFEPEWTRASILDENITQQGQAAGEAKARFEQSQKREDELRHKLEDSRREEARLASEIHNATSRLRILAPTFPVADRLEEVIAGIEERTRFEESVHILERERDRRHKAVETALRAEKNSIAQVPGYQAQANLLAGEISNLQGKIVKLNGSALQKRLDILGEFDGYLKDASSAASDAMSAAASEQSAKEEKSSAEETVRKESEALREYGDKAQKLDQTLAYLYTSALAISDEAERLRLQLEEGRPCPVCGSQSHPYLKSGAKALSISADAITKQMKPLELEKRRIAAAIQKLTGAIQEARSTARTAAGGIADACGDCAKARAEFKSAISSASPLVTRLKLQLKLPVNLAASSDEQINDARKMVKERIRDVKTSLGEFHGHSEAFVKAQRQLHGVTENIRKAQDLEKKLRGERETASKELSACAIDLTKAQGDLENNGKRLFPMLALLEIAPEELSADALAVAERVKSHAHSIISMRIALSSNQSELTACQSRIAGENSDHRSEESALRNFSTDHQKKSARLLDLVSERTLLLGGEATDVHRQRYRDVLRDAHENIESARRRVDEASTELNRVNPEFELAKHQFERIHADSERLEFEFNGQCTKVDLLPDEATALLSVPSKETQALGARLRSIDQRIQRAEQALALRQRDLDAAGPAADGVPENPAEDSELQKNLDAVNEARDKANQDRGAVMNRLASDDQSKEQAQKVQVQIAEQEASCVVWKEMNEAIGSQKGDKFRTFAQSITLEQLVRIANRDLESIAPRYRLAKGGENNLALHVVDCEMESEQRSTRSLSGGERFLVSLALALSSLTGRQSFVDTLFIDEGFGSLDADSLDTAIAALEKIQNFGRKVGIITHLDEIKERVPVQIVVEKIGAGRSRVSTRSAA